MSNIKWIYSRVKSMTVKEIFYRINQKLKIKVYKVKFRNEITINDIFTNRIDDKKINILNKNIQILWDFSKMNPSYFNKVKIFNLEVDLEKEFSWHGFNKIEWNKEKFSFDIEYKNNDSIGEIRQIWELNRHIFLPPLFLKSIRDNELKSYENLKKLFYDWIEKNSFLKGVNWSSSMEISIRAYQWLLIYSIIKDNDDNKFKNDLLKSIINSIEYVTKNFSRYSSANNHLIVESAISSLIGYIINPVFDNNWFKTGYEILNRELVKQFYEDGVNKEHATHYHAFVVDIWLQYNCFLKSINENALHENLLMKSIEFLGYLKYDKSFLEFGDSDDAKIINLSGSNYNYYEYILQFGSIYFSKNLTIENNISEFIFWKILKFDDLQKYIYDKINFFELSGYFIYRNNNNLLLFDIANLGFDKIAAHGHADCLSICYVKDNLPIFIDPGTYVYNIKRDFRDYFRSTEVHNTLNYNGKSQSKIEGSFLWSKKANIIEKNYINNDNFIIITGSHDGYYPFIHKRTLIIHNNFDLIIIKDEFNKENSEINFTLHKDVKIDKIDNRNYKLNNKVFFQSTECIEIKNKYMSPLFLELEHTSSLNIEKKHKNNIITVISDEKICFENNTLIYKEFIFNIDKIM